MLTISIVEFKPLCWQNVKAAIEKTNGVEIYGEDASRALVVIESSDEKGVEEICKALHEASEDIISISHHSFYFDEEDVSNLPPADELFRRKRES